MGATAARTTVGEPCGDYFMADAIRTAKLDSTALISAVLGSSVVLVCRPQTGEEEGFYDDVVRALEDRIAERLDAFEEMGLVGADYFVSAIGPAFEVFAQYSRIVKLSGEEVDVSDLMVLARQAVARHAMRRLLGPDSLDCAGPGVAVLPDLAVGLPHGFDPGG